MPTSLEVCNLHLCLLPRLSPVSPRLLLVTHNRRARSVAVASLTLSLPRHRKTSRHLGSNPCLPLLQHRHKQRTTRLEWTRSRSLAVTATHGVMTMPGPSPILRQHQLKHNPRPSQPRRRNPCKTTTTLEAGATPVLCLRPPPLLSRSSRRNLAAGVMPARSELLPHRLLHRPLLQSKTSAEDRMTCLATCGVEPVFSAFERDGCALAYGYGWKSM